MSKKCCTAPPDACHHYMAVVSCGQTIDVYCCCRSDSHGAALESALLQHQQIGYDLRGLTSAATFGPCSDTECPCGGRDCAVRYGLNPLTVNEVIHLKQTS